MDPLRRLDDQLLLAINSFARTTTWLHVPMLAYAKYGMALFALLLLAGMLISRRSKSQVLASAGWACIATLLALGLNQPFGHIFRETRPYVTHPQLLRLADVTTDFSFPSDHAVMGGAVAAGLLLVNHRTKRGSANEREALSRRPQLARFLGGEARVTGRGSGITLVSPPRGDLLSSAITADIQDTAGLQALMASTRS